MEYLSDNIKKMVESYNLTGNQIRLENDILLLLEKALYQQRELTIKAVLENKLKI